MLTHKWGIAAIAMILALAVPRPIACTSSVDLSPNSLNFGSLRVGMTSGISAITITNHLNVPVMIASITIMGDFAQTNNCTVALNPGQGCTIKASFTPTAVGSRTGEVRVIDDSGTGPHITQLWGTGSISGLASLSLAPAYASLPLGLRQQFTATGRFKNGASADLTTSAIWTSTSVGQSASGVTMLGSRHHRCP